MKGVVFTEFLEMVESKFSADMVDDIIDASELPSEGAYTSIGTYDHKEMVQLVSALSQRTELEVPLLLKTFGVHLFGRFVLGFPTMFEGRNNAYEFMENVEGCVHVEVRKLYADAELPTFETKRNDDGSLEMVYTSVRGLADFAEGLITGCIAHYGGGFTVSREDLDGPQKARFILRPE